MNVKKLVEHLKYPELGQGEVLQETEGKTTVKFGNRTVVFLSSDLSEVPPSRRQIFVLRGEDRLLLDDVKEEQNRFILQAAQNWATVDELVVAVTTRFAEYRREDGKPLNQGGFDPMFCVSYNNPGYFIRTGLLIARESKKDDRSRYEFKTRANATSEEISKYEAFVSEAASDLDKKIEKKEKELQALYDRKAQISVSNLISSLKVQNNDIDNRRGVQTADSSIAARRVQTT